MRKPAEMTDLDRLRHSTAHVLAQAVHARVPRDQDDHRPSDRRGLLLRFRPPHAVHARGPGSPGSGDGEERRPRTSRSSAARSRARKRWSCSQDNPYKMELIASCPEGERITGLQQRRFTDLCRGPHVGSTGADRRVQAAERGRRLLARRREEPAAPAPLRHRLRQPGRAGRLPDVLEEAKRRDHRELGRELGLFTISRWSAPGLPLWLPKGAHRCARRWTTSCKERSWQARLPAGLSRRTSAKLELYEISRPLPVLRGQPVPPIDAWTRTREYCSSR